MILALLIDGYTFVVFVAVVLSWFRLSPDNPVVKVTAALTEPVLAPIRKILPAAGGFDFSPMVLLLGLQLLRRLLFR
jgi:YggT family protein